ncbi:MAG TPA: hypothetical protein DD435_06845 [Cyanobacteria bacterium UBA8530]|nr:hypothetical protein [Cyanobacteria bacterium UBA8530]
MDIQKFFQSLTEPLTNRMIVKSIFGDPITAGDKTIIPVAKLSFGFGGGFGNKIKEEDDEGGGGGGGAVIPLGVVEVGPQATHFISIEAPHKIIGALAAGFFLGLVLARHHRH